MSDFTPWLDQRDDRWRCRRCSGDTESGDPIWVTYDCPHEQLIDAEHHCWELNGLGRPELYRPWTKHDHWWVCRRDEGEYPCNHVEKDDSIRHCIALNCGVEPTPLPAAHIQISFGPANRCAGRVDGQVELGHTPRYPLDTIIPGTMLKVNVCQACACLYEVATIDPFSTSFVTTVTTKP